MVEGVCRLCTFVRGNQKRGGLLLGQKRQWADRPPAICGIVLHPLALGPLEEAAINHCVGPLEKVATNHCI